MLTGIKLKAYPTREQKRLSVSGWGVLVSFTTRSVLKIDTFEAMQESIALSMSMPLWTKLIVNLKTKSLVLFFLMSPVSFLEIAPLTGIKRIEGFLKASLAGLSLRKKSKNRFRSVKKD